ncbi:DUF1236 domain-containing protein [Phaeovulum sp.]|uniref:DUF1236 domain-containing protein n=1 Tax=Phaeovulum sp. TaxID=2934796 RepID=UPI00272FE253|nr:DUF1236 domain-containing protein [Phaeovulum sp.]MDP1667611.1 DUF1236 domain-containing protein [Phaeovulum sp.]MDZ4118498.1 DUF1236 domain-containing protein [Phaeovulum sp.]
MTVMKTLALSLAGILLASVAMAETQATAWTDLNLRAGPGPTYKIRGVIPANETVRVDGCLEAAVWCKVTYAGVEGWASGSYLTTNIDNAPMALTLAGPKVVLNTVTYTENPDDAALAGGASGALAGALIAGPVGAVIGGIIGAAVGVAAVTDPDPQYVAYVQSNPVETVYLDGEVVVGAGIPEPVTLYPVPGSDYSYIYVNGVPVLVETPTRKVVYILR